MGKGAYEGSFRNFFIYFLDVTYSRVLKKKKCSNRLAIAAFLKSVAIGPPKGSVPGKLRIFGCPTYSRVF